MTEPRPAGVTVTWIGHATVLVETPGARIITDPVLRHRVAHLLRQVPDPPDPGPVDAVLLSHLHHDHFDKPSLRTVATAETTVVLPTGAAHYLDRIPFGRVLELRAGETVTIGDATVRAVPAWHDGRRRPGPGVVEHDTLGYLIGDVWFAGDTDIDDDMAALRGACRRGADPDLGLGHVARPGPSRPQGRSPGDGARAAADGGADPLGHVPPDRARAPLPGVAGRAAARVRPSHGGARARRRGWRRSRPASR